ncbi:MAG: hypothetical protein LUG86_07950 [Oscillospiraceae bacterium]|nr:hypothetical protein [Oscillospiraceae bacterium]
MKTTVAKLSDAIGMFSDRILQEADALRGRKRANKAAIRFVAIGACVAVVVLTGVAYLNRDVELPVEPVEPEVTEEPIIEDEPVIEEEEPITEDVIEPDKTPTYEDDSVWDGNYEVMPEVSVGGGGDENYEFIETTSRDKIGSISTEFIYLDYIGWDAATEWIREHASINLTYTSVAESANLYSFILYFEIPDETVREILKSQQLGLTDAEFTDEEIDLLLSRDNEAIAAYFAADTTIVKGENIYSLYWIYCHSIDDYIAEGITQEDIAEILPKFDEVGMSNAARQAITAKLEDYINGNY